MKVSLKKKNLPEISLVALKPKRVRRQAEFRFKIHRVGRILMVANEGDKGEK
jgi:hypothetical protein